jgi:Fe-S cluster assembly ATP-binding protein
MTDTQTLDTARTETTARPVDATTRSTDDELVIRDLHVVPVAEPSREILKGINLTVRKGEVHTIMGRNGSGKTTLAYALMGHPGYQITSGEILWKGRNLVDLSPDKRGRLGLFLAFQYPTAVPGLSVASFLRTALNARMRPLEADASATDASAADGASGAQDAPVDPSDPFKGGIKMADFRRLMRDKMSLLKLEDSFAARYLNEGFSGGEKKRLEMLQMAVLQPEMAVLDETDSGLDIDALRIVAEGLNAQLNPNLGVLLITHYQRMLNYITPDHVHVLAAGRIIASGGKELALRLEQEGYAPIMLEAGIEPTEAEAGPEADVAEPAEPDAPDAPGAH